MAYASAMDALGDPTRRRIVTERREGTRRIYRLDPDGLGELRAYFDTFWTTALESFEAAVERKGEEKQ